MTEAAAGTIVNDATDNPFGYGDGCVERGPTLAYDAQAFEAAKKVVAEIVSNSLDAGKSALRQRSATSVRPDAADKSKHSGR